MRPDDDLRQQALDAVPPGHCAMLELRGRARLTRLAPVAHLVHEPGVTVDHQDDGSAIMTWSEETGHVAGEMFALCMRMVEHGTALVSSPIEQYVGHPADCPVCEEAALPGPPVWAVWLPEPWYHSYVRAGLVAHNPLTLWRFANRGVADRLLDRAAGVLRRRPQRGGLGHVALPVLDRDPRRAPTRTTIGVCDTSQLWLWHEDPVPTGQQWPDEVLVLDDDRRPAAITPAELRLRAARAEAATAARVNVGDGCQVTLLDGCTITWVQRPDTEAVLVSIHDPESTHQVRRVLADGTIEPLLSLDLGLTLYGTCGKDRPHFSRAARYTPEYAQLLRGVREGRGERVAA